MNNKDTAPLTGKEFWDRMSKNAKEHLPEELRNLSTKEMLEEFARIQEQLTKSSPYNEVDRTTN